jgi:hypothetical protein
LADGELVGRDTIDSQGQSRRVDVLVDRLEEVGGLEITPRRWRSAGTLFGGVMEEGVAV